MGATSARQDDKNRAPELYQRMRDAIVNGEFRPNERLVEADLAERLQVSRTPIRDCLHRLVTDGLVTRVRRGWVVHEHTPDEIREIYEVRAALEGWAVRLGALRATDEELGEIRRVHQEADKLDIAQLRDRVVELTKSFHERVVATCHNERLLTLIQQSREYYFNTRLARVYTDEELLDSIRSQQSIVDALLDRNPEKAEQLTREHIQEALEAILAKPM